MSVAQRSTRWRSITVKHLFATDTVAHRSPDQKGMYYDELQIDWCNRTFADPRGSSDDGQMAMDCTTNITSSIVIMSCSRKTRLTSATAMLIQPIIQGGAVCMGTATTQHIGIGEDCEQSL
jgi:hypothetical protein